MRSYKTFWAIVASVLFMDVLRYESKTAKGSFLLAMIVTGYVLYCDHQENVGTLNKVESGGYK